MFLYTSIYQILVTLYYESLCPDCHEFFTKQLKPSYDLFKEFVDIHFIPFGNAHVRFVCSFLISVNRIY